MVKESCLRLIRKHRIFQELSRVRTSAQIMKIGAKQPNGATQMHLISPRYHGQHVFADNREQLRDACTVSGSRSEATRRGEIAGGRVESRIAARRSYVPDCKVECRVLCQGGWHRAQVAPPPGTVRQYGNVSSTLNMSTFRPA